MHTLKAELFGSLGATGHGHGSGPAVLLGLEGGQPETVDTDTVRGRVEGIQLDRKLRLLGRHEIVRRRRARVAPVPQPAVPSPTA